MWNKIRNLYERRSIQLVFSVALTAVSLLCFFLLTSVFSHYANYVVEGFVQDKASQRADILVEDVENQLSEAIECSNSIYYTIIKQYDRESAAFSNQMQLFYQNNRDTVADILLCGKDGGLLWEYPKSGAQIQREAPIPTNKINGSIDRIFFSAPHIQRADGTAEQPFEEVLTAGRYVEVNQGGNIQPGILWVQLRYEPFHDIFQSAGGEDYSYAYLQAGDGQYIYHPKEREMASGMYEETAGVLNRNTDGSYKEETGGKLRDVCVRTIGYTGWKLAWVTSLTDAFAGNIRIQAVLWLVMLLLACVLVLVNRYVVRKITNPILQLSRTLDAFGEGNLDIQARVYGSGEVADLSRRFNEMAHSIRSLMNRIVKREQEKREMDLKLLQSQINPHFLYNTLDSIIWMIEGKQYGGASEMVSALAAFFRVSLSKGKDIIPLKKELEHAKSYLTIQNIRFQDKFTYHFEVDESLERYVCPKLIIQPLIENAVYHGMEGKYEDGEIWIRVYAKNEHIRIEVADNGDGMDAETVRRILTGPVVSSKRGSGIGVRNVNERIRLCFGEPYGLEIFSEVDEGTTVRITIPKVEDDYAVHKKKGYLPAAGADSAVGDGAGLPAQRGE